MHVSTVPLFVQHSCREGVFLSLKCTQDSLLIWEEHPVPDLGLRRLRVEDKFRIGLKVYYPQSFFSVR